MTNSTLAPPPDFAAALADDQAALRRELARSRRRLRLQLALETALDLAFGVVGAGAVLVALDWALRWEWPTRRLLLGAALVGLVAALIVRVVPRLRAASLDDLALALNLDRYRPGTGQQVADVLQLPGQLAEERSTASPALIRLAVRQAGAALAEADWRSHWNRRRTITRALGLLALLAIPVGFAVALPDAARLARGRWLLGSAVRWPQRTYLSVVGLEDRDRLVAPRDEPFPIEVRGDAGTLVAGPDTYRVPGRGRPLGLDRPPASPLVPDEVRLRERVADGTIRDSAMTVVSPGRFRFELPPAAASSSIHLAGGDDWLGPIPVERVDRPTLATTAIRVRDPGASEGAWRPIEDIRQSLAFLPDTEVELTLVGSEALQAATIDVHPGTAPPLNRIGPQTFTARWPLREATTLEIRLTSDATGLPSKPTFLSFGIVRDRDPRVTLRAQGVTAHVTAVATIPLTVAATDDIGLAALRIQVDRTVAPTAEQAEPVTTRQTVPIPLSTGGDRAVLDYQARHDLDLARTPPPVGTILRLQGEADDRCARGVQVGRSGVVHFQVVTADDLFYEILIRQRGERAKFVAAYDAANKLTPTLAGTPAADAYTTAARTLHTQARVLELIAGRIADSLAEMKLNQVGSPKSHRLLQEGVIDPILALNGGPVAELRNVLQGLAGGSAARGDADKARAVHGVVLQRMKQILDQMSQWESFVDVVNQVAEVIKIQQDVLKATARARDTRTEEVFDDKP